MSRRQRLLTGVLVFFLVMTNLAWGGLYWLTRRHYADVDQLGVFLDVFNSVSHRYVQEVPRDQLIDAAARSMVDSIGDPHSYYLTPEEYYHFMEQVDQAFEGVGMVVGIEDNQLRVVAPIEGSPAEKAGVREGDVIVTIDGRETGGLKLEEAVSLIRGPEGTKVNLSIDRQGQSGLISVGITRSKISLKTVQGRMVDNNIGYLRITNFTENTTKEFRDVIKQLSADGAQGYVLDVRSNPGGYLHIAVEIADYFVPKGPVVFVQGREGEPKSHNSTGKNFLNLPVVVLVNEGSASASEIVAGAIQDMNTGVLVGTKTYGKGSVQTIINLGNGGGLRLTTAEYFTPSGRSIQRKGITPDYVVQLTPDLEEDLQLEKGLEIVKTRMNQS